MITGDLIRSDANETANLANPMLPKYTTRILFLDVIAYILRQNQFRQLSDANKHGVPQRDKDFRKKHEQCACDHLGVISPGTTGRGMMSV